MGNCARGGWARARIQQSVDELVPRRLIRLNSASVLAGGAVGPLTRKQLFEGGVSEGSPSALRTNIGSETAAPALPSAPSQVLFRYADLRKNAGNASETCDGRNGLSV